MTRSCLITKVFRNMSCLQHRLRSDVTFIKMRWDTSWPWTLTFHIKDCIHNFVNLTNVFDCLNKCNVKNGQMKVNSNSRTDLQKVKIWVPVFERHFWCVFRLLLQIYFFVERLYSRSCWCRLLNHRERQRCHQLWYQWNRTEDIVALVLPPCVVTNIVERLENKGFFLQD